MGETNAEIEARVQRALGADEHPSGRVGWTVGNERRQHTDWWREFGPKVVEDRGVNPGQLEGEVA